MTYTAQNYPKNPVEPGEIVAAFYFFINNGDYLSAAKLWYGIEEVLAAKQVSEEQLSVAFKNSFAGVLKGRVIKQVAIRTVHVREYTDDRQYLDELYRKLQTKVTHRASVDVTIYFNDGTNEDSCPFLFKYDNKWRVEA